MLLIAQKKNLMSLLINLNTKQFKQVEEFLRTMPKLSHKLKVTNPQTGVESRSCIGGTGKFFQLGMDHMSLESYYKVNFALDATS